MVSEALSVLDQIAGQLPRGSQALHTKNKVALFCGGRGSTTIIQHLLDLETIDLSLMINAYDDGLSTGDLRDFIPGLLGISDFRKNLACILDQTPHQSLRLQKLLEMRLAVNIGVEQIAALADFVRGGKDERLPKDMQVLFAELNEKNRACVRDYLSWFFAYASTQAVSFKYADCALGNLVFAGAYLKHGSFNQAVKEMETVFSARAQLVNVCRGEPRTLVALKEDGTFLCREAEIVREQNNSPIRAFFFLDKPLGAEDVSSMAGWSVEQKEAELRKREKIPAASELALDVLEQADVIIYGPGTQHSSILPSYRICGVGDALRRSPASVRLFVVNLHVDHDIPSANAQYLVDRALSYMGDPDNRSRSITHILYNKGSQTDSSGIRFPRAAHDNQIYKGAVILEDNFASAASPSVHDGAKIAEQVLALCAVVKAEI